MTQKIQFRRGTAAQWTAANTVLASGEMGFETDTLKAKLGNGSLAWNDLPYISDGGQEVITDHGGLTGLSDDDHPQYHTDARGDARYYQKAAVDTALAAKADSASLAPVATSGSYNDLTDAPAPGGGGEIVMGNLISFTPSYAPSYSTATTGSGSIVGGRTALLRTMTTAGSYAYLETLTVADPVAFQGFHLWSLTFRASASITNSARSTNGLVVWGVGGGTMTASSFSPFRFVGFVIDRTAGVETWSAVVGNGTASTTTPIAGSPASPNALHWYLSILHTPTEVKFYRNGVLVATVTENIPNAASSHHQSSPVYIAIGNKTSAENHQINVYGHECNIVSTS